MKPQQAIQKAVTEFTAATEKYQPFNSPHEGFAVLKEEVDELWDLVKQDATRAELAAEAKQVAAMALRFLTDCC